MKIHYLEIVAANIDEVCHCYEAVHKVSFSAPDPLLGNARTAKLPDGVTIGVRGTLSEEEDYIVRPYWLVDDIDEAIESIEEQGAELIHAALEIPGRGKFAIYILAGVQNGLWQL